MKSHGVSVDLRHIILLADLMTFKGLFYLLTKENFMNKGKYLELLDLGSQK